MREYPLGFCDICGRRNVPLAIERSDGFYGLAICRDCVKTDAAVDRLLEIAPPPRPPFIDESGKLIYRI